MCPSITCIRRFARTINLTLAPTLTLTLTLTQLSDSGDVIFLAASIGTAARCLELDDD